MIDFVLIFVAVFVVDILYTYYLEAVQAYKAATASLLAAIIYVLGCLIIINYTENHLLLVAAALGALCGTYVGIKLRKSSNDDTDLSIDIHK